MKKSIYMSVALASLLALTGCGGGSSSSTPATPQSIEGTAYDPEIVGADITLVCGNNKYYSTSKTDDNGYFKIEKIPASEKLETCVLESTGGMDAAEDFKNLTLKAPVSMFDLSANEKVFITPLTSMVANDDDASDDISKALDNVAKFLKVNDTKLLNDKPSGDMAKIAKKLTLIAMAEKKTGGKVGFKALDTDDISESDLDTFKNNLDLSDDDKAELNETFTSIDNTDGSSDEIKKLSVKRSVKKLLLSAYSLKKSDANHAEYIKNINTLSEKITNALKLDNTKYTVPNRYIIRKALSDVSLSVSLKEDDSLKDELYTKLTEDNVVFNSKLEKVLLDIKNVKGVTLYEVDKYSKVLGNDNDKRIEYYTFSDLSHLGEAIKIAQTSYDDNVLDPIYKKIALGYVKLGFNDEAVSIANNNIYSDSVQISALIEVSSALIKNNKNELALSTLDSAFNNFKIYANTIGEQNLSNTELSLIINILENYNKLANKNKSNAVVAYMNDKIVKNAKPIMFNSLSYTIAELMEKAVFEKRNADVKYLAEISADFALQVPIEEQDGNYNYVYRSITYILPYMSLVDLEKKGDELIKHGDKAPGFREYFDTAEQILAHELLSNTVAMNAKAKELDDYTGEDKNTRKSYYDLLRNGLVVALVKDNQEDLAVKLLTKYWPFLSNWDPSKTRPDVFKFYVNSEKPYASRLLGAIDNAKQEAFLKALLEDSKVKENPKDAWTFIRTGASWKDKNKDMYIALFNSFGPEVGYPTMIRHFAENGSYGEIKAVIETANEYINDKIETPIYKVQSTIALLKVLSEFDYFSKVSEDELQTKLNNDVIELSKTIVIDSDASTYKNDVKFSLEIAKYLALNKNLDKAKEILSKIQASLVAPTEGSLSEVKSYIITQIGMLNETNERDTMDEVLLGAYISTQQFDKAEALIDDSKSQLDKIVDSLDKNEPLLFIARAYAAINKREKALDTLNKISTIKEKNQAKLFVTKYLANFDSFPETDVASVDTDGDGKPDFFNKSATQEQITKSGLTLDEDIDGDGVNDDADKFPYSKDHQ